LVGNCVIAVAYTAIMVAIYRPLIRSGQFWTNRLATTTGLIFFSCAVGHAFHAVAAAQAILGATPVHATHAATSGWSLWPSALWDLFTAGVGVYYWSLRRGYGVLLGRGALFVDPEEQRRLAEIDLREQVAAGRAEAAAERAAQAAILRAVIDSSQSLVYVKDLEGRYVLVNEAFEKAFGVREADVVGHTDEEVAPDRAEVWRANDRRALHGTVRVEETATGADGERVYESVKFPLRDAAGEVHATCGVSLDVTDLRRAVRAAEEARDEALAQSEVKSQFLAAMSHEIRTPMNSVIGLADLLLRTDLDEGQRRYAGGIHEAGTALLDVINGILDFSKIEAGRVMLEDAEFALPALVRDVATIIAPTAAAKGLEFVTDVSPDLPALVSGDPGRLRQILLNLLGNAVKFTERGSVTLRVDLAEGGEGVGDAEVTVRFTVADTGIGIAADDLARLFEPFAQADASITRHFGGTGLGLSISRELATAMGGTLGVSSTPGAGSTFTYRVPLRRVADTAPAGPAEAVAEVPAGLAGLRVLVVEPPGPDSRVGEQFRRWQLATTVVPDTAAARQELRLAAHRGRPYDVAVVDGDCTEIDGRAFAARVAADPLLPQVHVVLMCGSAEGGRDGEKMADGAADLPGLTVCVGKPVDHAQLLTCLARVLGGGATRTPPEAAAHPRPGEGRRVLLVEDNELNQLVAEGILDRLGYRHDVAVDGVEALRLAGERDYDAILMDCQMPRMDGYTATAELRRREAGQRRTPVIAMTAGVQVSDQERCLAAGMDDYVGKPVDPGELERVLLRWTGTAPPVPRPRGRHRVLVAEDNAINAKLAAHSLRRLGYDVEVVPHGRAALDALAASDYDAVLMDCEMPVLDGYATTREFRSGEPPGHHTPIIALTASAMAADRERCLEAGMDDYLAKPVWDEHLAAVLRRLVGAPGPAATTPSRVDEADLPRDELVELYLRTMAPRVDELIERLRAAAADDVVALTHDLRPTSAVVGAFHLSQLLTEVEDLARTRPADLPGAVDTLAAEHRRVLRELTSSTT
jgi:PAS domain S-box-containing protein